MHDQSTHVSHIGHMGDKLKRIDEFAPRFPAARKLEGENRADAAGQVFLRRIIIFIPFKPGVINRRNLRMGGEIF